MIGYFTDNSISQSVMRSFSRGGMKVQHIKDFDPFNCSESFFYGILRGTGVAMRHLQFLGEDYWYSDNGYFDAIYMDENKQKDMSGTYRIVKNDMIEPMDIEPIKTSTGKMRVMLIPPSPYTAFMYDTTPEDWMMEWTRVCAEAGHVYFIRDKEERIPFVDAVKDMDAVLAFNSIAVMKAMDLGKAVYTTYGIIRNADMIKSCAPYYDIDAVKKFYEPKQFTLEQIKDLGVKCLR